MACGLSCSPDYATISGCNRTIHEAELGIKENNAKIDYANEQIAANEQTLEPFDDVIAGFKCEINSLNAAIQGDSSINSAIASLTEQQKNMENKKLGMEEEIASLKAEVASLEARNAELQSAIATAQATLASNPQICYTVCSAND